MSRRIHVSSTLKPGMIQLDQPQAHHLRDVLRLGAGDPIEVFDNAGNVAQATIEHCDSGRVELRVQQVVAASAEQGIIIASAVPKGERADWMIEKLSELGVSRFIPLETARSVVHPTGRGKHDRWLRIAVESAKQSQRAGVMQIEPLTSLDRAVESASANAWFLSTSPGAFSILNNPRSAIRDPQLFVGPEGGWTEQELALFGSKGLTAAKLTETILRVETAAVAGAAILAARLAANSGGT